MSKFKAWFTSARRQAIYVFFSSTAAMLVSMGFLTEGDAGHWLTLSALVLQAVSGVLQLFNMNRQQVTAWFTSAGRAAIYGGAVTVGAVGVGLGWFTEAQSASWLTIISAGLTVFGAGLAVITLNTEGQGVSTGPDVVASTES